jgi:hypothetical protein
MVRMGAKKITEALERNLSMSGFGTAPLFSPRPQTGPCLECLSAAVSAEQIEGGGLVSIKKVSRMKLMNAVYRNFPEGIGIWSHVVWSSMKNRSAPCMPCQG